MLRQYAVNESQKICTRKRKTITPDEHQRLVETAQVHFATTPRCVHTSTARSLKVHVVLQMSAAMRALASAIRYKNLEASDVHVPDRFESARHAAAVWTTAAHFDAREIFAVPCSRNGAKSLHLHAIDLDSPHPGVLLVDKGRVMARRVARRTQAEGDRSQDDTDTSKEIGASQMEVSVALPLGESNGGVPSKRHVVMSRPDSDDIVQPEEPMSIVPSRRPRPAAIQRRVEVATNAEITRRTLPAEARKQGRKRSGEKPTGREAETIAVASKRTPSSTRERSSASRDQAVRRALDACLHATPSIELDSPHDVEESQYVLYENPIPHDRLLQGLVEATTLRGGVEAALARGEPSDACVIYDGPPGTGKTRRLVSDAVELRDAGARILVLHPSNAGCAALYVRMHMAGCGCSLIAPRERLPEGTPAFPRRDDVNAQVIICTPAARRGLRLTRQRFTHVLVDEAGQMPEMIVWSALDDVVERVLLYGDVKQLPGILTQASIARGLNTSLMERLMRGGYPSEAARVQFRMHPEIVSFPSRHFYDGELRTDPSVMERARGIDAPPFQYVRVRGREERIGTSYHNRAEAEVAQRVATELLGQCGDVVVLVPYVAQAQLLASLPCPVMTIDAFQGKEAECVVLCLVRTDGLGFWADERRLNVALTRAKGVLRVIGVAAATWGSHALAQLARDAEERGLCHDAD